jgi:hypothetical protein
MCSTLWDVIYCNNNKKKNPCIYDLLLIETMKIACNSYYTATMEINVDIYMSCEMILSI